MESWVILVDFLLSVTQSIGWMNYKKKKFILAYDPGGKVKGLHLVMAQAVQSITQQETQSLISCMCVSIGLHFLIKMPILNHGSG